MRVGAGGVGVVGGGEEEGGLGVGNGGRGGGVLIIRICGFFAYLECLGGRVVVGGGLSIRICVFWGGNIRPSTHPLPPPTMSSSPRWAAMCKGVVPSAVASSTVGRLLLMLPLVVVMCVWGGEGCVGTKGRRNRVSK